MPCLGHLFASDSCQLQLSAGSGSFVSAASLIVLVLLVLVAHQMIKLRGGNRQTACMRMCVLVVCLVWCGAVWCRGVRWVGWGPSGQRPYLNSLSQTASSSVARRHGKVRTPQLLAVSSARLALRSHRAVAKQQGLSLAWMYCPDRKMYAAMAPAAHSSQRRPLRCMSFSFSVLALEYLADSSKSQTKGHNQLEWGAVVRSAGRPSAGSCTSSEAETSRKQSDSNDSCVYLRACRAWWSKPRRRECHNTAPLHRLHEHCIDGQWS